MLSTVSRMLSRWIYDLKDENAMKNAKQLP